MPDDPDRPKLGNHGGPRTKGQQGHSVTLRLRGNSVDYILARLEREGLDDWAEAIRARRISAYAVSVELGWARRPQTVRGENSNQAKRRAYDLRRAYRSSIIRSENDATETSEGDPVSSSC